MMVFMNRCISPYQNSACEKLCSFDIFWVDLLYSNKNFSVIILTILQGFYAWSSKSLNLSCTKVHCNIEVPVEIASDTFLILVYR